jgi:hypothetical protein
LGKGKVSWYFGEVGSIKPYPGGSGIVDGKRWDGRQWEEEGGTRRGGRMGIRQTGEGRLL